MRIKHLSLSFKEETALKRALSPLAGSPLAMVLAIGLCTAGCSIAPLAKHTAAFSAATCLVVDNSSNAYRAAIDLHEEEQISAGILQFQHGVAWDPHNDKPLISEEGLEARLEVLEAVKTYAQSLADVTSGIDSPALDKAAASTGTSLRGLADEFAKQQGSSATSFALTPEMANGVSTAARALGEYLIAKKIKREVPSIIRSMDPQIQSLCSLLSSDVAILRRQAKKDYEDLFRQQEIQIKQDLKADGIRDQIAKLPEILRKERHTDAMLAELQTAVTELAATHHALAAERANQPEALRARIAELTEAGERLGKYYQALPTK